MTQTAITVEEVGRAIDARPWRLRFAPALETAFERDTADARCRQLILHNYIGIAIYDAFLLGDWVLLPDIFKVSLALHLLVMTPIMGMVIALIARRPPAWLRESVLAGGIVLGTAAILGLMLYSRSPLRTSEHISVVLVILFATMVQRIRFLYVLAACVTSLILYVAALATFVHHDPARMAVADAVFAGVVLFSLIGCYNLEYEQRTGYLLGLRDRLRNEELEALSRHDALTGVGNRRALEHALARASKADTTAVLLCDIDHFKAYNDANGHLAGDAALKRVAALIAAGLRHGSDDVFRFGGEEFLVLLDGATLADASLIGERIRTAIEADGIMTISIGAAAGRPDALTEIIAAADQALYAAKRGGRNRLHADAGAADQAKRRPAA